MVAWYPELKVDGEAITEPEGRLIYCHSLVRALQSIRVPQQIDHTNLCHAKQNFI